MANPRKLRMIFQNDSKNDRLDAEQLARVARLDPKLPRMNPADPAPGSVSTSGLGSDAIEGLVC